MIPEVILIYEIIKLRIMQNKILRMLMVFVILFSFTSCEVIGDIFKAGMGFGIFIVIFIIAIIIFIFAKLFGNK
ncbi:hypothetical protein B0A81_17220 [Flavobacterium plurextorum]|uniref:Phosphatidate cytidylyltransferase n=1 Tax=Flavobacterium plurextorum TaxID=1114867 RepID=A0ABX4CQF5_9FLAO|nr:hypothetical protein B0A81_17220 [Flavobacterium plurextorum]